MIGPSSSHTAGALRIALLARKMVKGTIRKVDFVLYGSFARTYRGHGTDKALVAGILGFGTEDYRIRDSFEYARKEGLEYRFIANTEKKDIHPNTVAITITDIEGQTTVVVGESIGGGAAVIRGAPGLIIRLIFGGLWQDCFPYKIEMPGLPHKIGVVCGKAVDHLTCQTAAFIGAYRFHIILKARDPAAVQLTSQAAFNQDFFLFQVNAIFFPG